MKRSLSTALLLLLLVPTPGLGQWRKLAAYSGTFFNEVFFYNASNGWLTQFNTTIVRTTDGGSSWQTSTLPNGSGSFNRDICFVSTSVGFVSGDDGIWKTTDGGANWTDITPPSITITGSSSHWFIDGNVGVYGFGGCADSVVTFCRTTDGGANWATVTYTHTADVAVGGMTAFNGIFYAAGGNGKTWRSTDNGANWTLVVNGSAGWQEDMVVSPSGALFTASANGASCGSTGGGKVMRSTDGGANWTASSFPSVVMWGVTMYSSTDGWACGDGGKAYKTTDGGGTWNESSCGMDALDRVDDIHFTGSSNGWAVGDGIYKFVGLYYSTRPDTIDFGDVLVGATSADSAARIKAVGPDGSVTSRALAGRDPSQFGITGGSGGFPMTYCQESMTPVHFNPTSEGIKIARLDFIVPGQPDTPHVYLRGRGVAPHILAPATLQFDTLLCSNTGLDTLVVTNSGTYQLRITGASFENMTGGSFQLVSPSTPIDIPPGASRNLVVRVTASGNGPVSGDIALPNTDTDPGKSPWRTRMTVYRRTIVTRLAPDTLLVIPSGPINTAVSGCLDYINGGDGVQTIENVTMASGSGAISQLPEIKNAAVAPGARSQICFQVTANDTGWVQRRFRVRTIPCGIDTFVTVRYYARNPIIGAPADRTLPPARCGEPAYDTVTIANTGNAPLVLERPYFTGPDAAAFEIVSPTAWPDTVPVGGSRQVVVRQIPGAGAGQKTAALVFLNNDLYPKKSPWTVQIKGRADVDSLDLSRRTIDLGDICNGSTTVGATVTIINAGTAVGTILGVSSSSAQVGVALDVDPTGHTLPAGGRDSLRLAVTPTNTGPFSATVELLFGDCPRRDTITVTGRVIGYDLAAAPVSFGVTRIGAPVQRTVPVTNNGTQAATVLALRIEPPTPGVTIVAPVPSSGFQLQPGVPVPVTLQFLPGDTLPLNASLVVVVDGPCPDSLIVPLDGRGLRGDLLPARAEVIFQSSTSCDAGVRIDSVAIRNLGAAPLEIRGTSFTSTGGFVDATLPGSLPRAVVPGDSAVIALTLKDGFTGTIHDTLLVATSDPNQPTLRIPITARRDRVELRSMDSAGAPLARISVPVLAHCVASRIVKIRLANPGTVADTVDLAAATGSVTISPSTVLLEPGTDTVVSVIVTMTSRGTLADTLSIVSRPCDLRSRHPIDARWASVTATLPAHDFAGVNTLRSAEELTDFTNTGEIDQTIEQIYIESPANGFTIIGSYVGTVVPAGGVLPVRIGFAPPAEGPSSTVLVVVTGEPCHDTIRALITGTGIRSNINIGIRGLAYGARLGCDDSCAVVTIEGTGPKPVRISGALLSGISPAAYTVDPDPLSRTLMPGDVASIRICFDPSKVEGNGTASLTIASDDSAQPQVLVRLSGTRTPGLTAPAPIDLGTLPPGAVRDTVVAIANPGSTPITIGGASLPDGYTLATGTLPIVVAPGDTARLPLRFTSDSAGVHVGLLTLRTSAPCVDSLTVPLSAEVSAEERYELILSAGRGFGRWGTPATIPVTIGNRNRLAIRSIDLAVTASGRLLDPRALRVASPSGTLNVERTGYDGATGELLLRISAADGSELPTGDIVLEIDYMVLRGDLITTPVELRLVPPVAPTVDAVTTPGAFTLEDYCDAYGRLLRATGNVELKPAMPNPARGAVTFELEIPFTGQVRFALYDDRGREVLRPVDEILPAGRRRLDVDLSELPSGAYICRYTIGLQTLTQRLVVVQ